MRYGVQLVVLDPEHLQTARKTHGNRLKAIPRQIQGLQNTKLPEGLAVHFGAGQFVVAEVELDQEIQQGQVIAADFGYGVVQHH